MTSSKSSNFSITKTTTERKQKFYDSAFSRGRLSLSFPSNKTNRRRPDHADLNLVPKCREGNRGISCNLQPHRNWGKGMKIKVRAQISKRSSQAKPDGGGTPPWLRLSPRSRHAKIRTVLSKIGLKFLHRSFFPLHSPVGLPQASPISEPGELLHRLQYVYRYIYIYKHACLLYARTRMPQVRHRRMGSIKKQNGR